MPLIFAVQTPVESNFALELKQAMALGPENITTDHCALLATDVKGMKNLFFLCCYNQNVMRINDQVGLVFNKDVMKFYYWIGCHTHPPSGNN